MCVGAVPGEEDSAYVITDITQADPDLPSDLIEIPVLGLFEPGEPEIVPARKGTLELSLDYCGDLIYVDSKDNDDKRENANIDGDSTIN